MAEEIKDEQGNVVATIEKPEEAFWNNVVDRYKENIKTTKENLKFMEAVVAMAEEKVKDLNKPSP